MYKDHSVKLVDTPDEQVNPNFSSGSILGAYEAITARPATALFWAKEHDTMVKEVLQFPQDSKVEDDSEDEDSEGGDTDTEITKLSDQAAITAVDQMKNDPANKGLLIGLTSSEESVGFHPGKRARGKQGRRKSGSNSKRGRGQ